MKRWRIILLGIVAAALAVMIALFAVGQRKDPTTPTEWVPQTWQEARVSAMHVAHVGQQKIACNECHTSGFDAGPVPEASCTRCHEKAAARAHKGSEKAPTPCKTCHVFRGGESAKACVECHADPTKEGKPALAHHAKKEIACSTCHDLHGETRAVLADCTGCHQGASSTHGHTVVAARDGGVTFESAVASLTLDAGVVREQRAASPSSKEPVAPGHASPGQACSACHAPHAAAPAARDTCRGCHVEPRDAKAALAFASVPRPLVEPHGKNTAGHPACTTCHEPHRTTKADVKSCGGCHQNRLHATLNEKGHTACTSCHAPHAPADAKASCASCHANVQALAAPKVKEHAACTSCHDPHEPKRPAALSCAKCHEKLEPKHPQMTGDPGHCVGCHTPHPKPGASLAVACSSCHTKAKNDRAFHAASVACGSCHVKHDFALDRRSAGTAFCATCHAPIKAATLSRSGHAECRTCHGAPHEPTKKPSCATCHATEASSAPKGHASCTSCHDAHSGSLGKNASCTNCHKEKATALHGNVAPGGCASCHQPHAGAKGATSRPACTTCHEPKKLPGLHTVNAHAADCSSCHTAHGSPKSERATCTGTCHTARKDHQPAAAVCKGCHMFRR